MITRSQKARNNKRKAAEANSSTTEGIEQTVIDDEAVGSLEPRTHLSSGTPLPVEPSCGALPSSSGGGVVDAAVPWPLLGYHHHVTAARNNTDVTNFAHKICALHGHPQSIAGIVDLPSTNDHLYRNQVQSMGISPFPFLGSVQAYSHPQFATPPVMSRTTFSFRQKLQTRPAARLNADRPVFKLSIKLISTYTEISNVSDFRFCSTASRNCLFSMQNGFVRAL